MKIYTKKGDNGTTTLVGGQKTSKSGLRIDAYGTLDEVCAHLGYLASANFSLSPIIRQQLEEITSRVMDCSAIVASPDTELEKLPKITADEVLDLELWCDELLAPLPQIQHFTLPIGDPSMSYTHICRTVVRRAERTMVKAFQNQEKIPPQTLAYINRLSDYLYALGRHLQNESTLEEVPWRPAQKK